MAEDNNFHSGQIAEQSSVDKEGVYSITVSWDTCEGIRIHGVGCSDPTASRERFFWISVSDQ